MSEENRRVNSVQEQPDIGALLEARRREELETLDALYRVGHAFATASDLHLPVQYATDVATELTHAAFGAFFYNTFNEKGESYMLYTISGVEREAFSKFPMPRNTAVFAPTFNGEGVVRLDDVTKDPRYGKSAPHHGMPEGHLPVTSYLAVPVVSQDGKILGGLFFGHPDAGVFTEHAEWIALAIASQAAIGIQKARLMLESERERRLYQAVLSNTPDLIYTFDLEHRFVYANKALLSMWGKTWDEAIGKNCLELGYEPWHAAMHDREIEEVIATKRFIRGEVPFDGTNGRRIYDYIFTPVFDANGEVEAIAGTTRDVTERKETEEALRRSQARIGLSLEASEFVGTWDWDLVRDVISADERFARLYSIDPLLAAQGAPLEHYTKMIHPDDLARIEPLLRRVLEEGGAFAEEYRLIQPNGSVRWVVARGRVQADAGGKPVRFPGVAIDITERKRLQALAESQKLALELAVQGASLESMLNVLIGAVEGNSTDDVRASILLLDEDGLHLRHGSAIRLPDGYVQAIDGVAIGPKVGSCGTTAYTGKPTFVADIENDPLWEDFSELALAHGLRSCWSTPIISSKGKVLGTFAIYRTIPALPSDGDREMVEYISRTAGSIIEREQEAKVRQTIERTLRDNERRLRFLSELEEATRALNDPSDIMEVATRMTAGHLEASRCAYADVEPDGDHFTIRADYVADGSPSTVGYYSLALFGSKAVNRLCRSQTLIIRDVDRELTPEDGAEMFNAIGIKAIVTCPLVKEGRLHAMMAVHQNTPRDWTTGEISLMEAVAERCWAYIERVRYHAKLREGEEQYRRLAGYLNLMVDSALDFAIISMDVNGRIVSWNRGAETIFGFALEEVSGKDIDIIFTPEDIAAGVPEKERETAARTGRASDERWHVRKNGGRFYVSGVMAVMRDDRGQPQGYIKIAADRTEQKHAQEELIAARNAAEAANIAKSEFLANMSHEIRTPMNAVVGLSNILAMSQPLTQKQREFIQTLQMSADTLLALINDLLDIAKIEARTVELEQVPFSVTQLVQEVASMMAVRVKEKGLTFKGEGECVKHRIFIGDPTRLRQIVLNLCSNAIKFTETGGVQVAITCHETDDPVIENICIAVRDTGIGIPKEKLNTIFHKFVQADTSINRKYGGTGLGLAITKTLSEIMGGTIAVESEEGKGSVFTVCIPLRLASNDDIAAAEGTLPKLAEESVEVSIRPRILLVEDYAPNVIVARTFLEQFGYQVDVANNGIEAIDKIQTTRYAAVLMDVQMHGMNGLEATRLIRGQERSMGWPRLPIIGMTAHALAGDRERCIGVGMDDYIAKPFNPQQLETLLTLHVKD